MERIVLTVVVLTFVTSAFAQDRPDRESDCLEAAKILLVELDKIDPDHGFTQRGLTQQLYQESSESGGGPYVCQAYILMGGRGSLESLAMEYYLEKT